MRYRNNIFKNPRLRIVPAAALVMLACMSGLRAQPAPSIAETYKFVAEKTAIAYAARDPLSGKMEGVTGALTADRSMCTLTYVKTMTVAEQPVRVWEFTANLSQINPKMVRRLAIGKSDFALVYGFSNPGVMVQIVTTGRKPTIESKNTSFKDGVVLEEKSFSGPAQHFLTSDMESAERTVKAIEHLVRQCGGRDELF